MWFVAVHTGAGRHATPQDEQVCALMKHACERGKATLLANESACEAVRAMIEILEDSALTNAGMIGSNRTQQNTIECEATLVDGKSGWHGTCAAVEGVPNPIQLASALLTTSSSETYENHLVPNHLVGNGAREWARKHGISVSTVPVAPLGPAGGRDRLDTVGAICIDVDGQCAAGTSSGGIANKIPGRIGPTGTPYASARAQSSSSACFAACSSGAGEHIVRTRLLERFQSVMEKNPPLDLEPGLHQAFEAAHAANGPVPLLAGVLGVCGTTTTSEGHCNFTGEWFAAFTTESMGIGMYSSTTKAPQATILRQSTGLAIHRGVLTSPKPPLLPKKKKRRTSGQAKHHKMRRK